MLRLISLSYVWSKIKDEDIPVWVLLNFIICIFLLSINTIICVSHKNIYTIILIATILTQRYIIKKNINKIEKIEKYSDIVFNIYLFIYYICLNLFLYTLFFK